MTSIHPPPSSAASQPPPPASLHLSLAPSTAPRTAVAASPAPSTPSSTSNGNSYSRRIASWGSINSETSHSGFSSSSIFGDDHVPLGGLPSPLDFGGEHSRRSEFGFIPSSFAAANGGGLDRVASWGKRSLGAGYTGGGGGAARGGRRRGDSIFQEIRDGSLASSLGLSERNDSGWMSSSAAATPSRGASSEVGEDGRLPPQRSKTLSFFDSASSSKGPSSSLRAGALSPPPNPPSRHNSLSSRHGRETSASSSLGSWGAFPSFPSASSSPVPPPPPPLPPTGDALRFSLASSTGGGSWLDDAAEEASSKTGSGLWTRGRGGSIGSIGSASAVTQQRQQQHRRRESPSPLGTRAKEEEAGVAESPVTALRPRLAALNTSSLLDVTSGGASSSLSSPSHAPLSSLPTAIEPPTAFITPSPSAASTSSTARAARLLNYAASPSATSSSSPSTPFTSSPHPPSQPLLGSLPSPASIPFPSSSPLSSGPHPSTADRVRSGATTPLADGTTHDYNLSTPQQRDRDRERAKKSSSTSSTTATPSSAFPTPFPNITPHRASQARTSTSVGSGAPAVAAEDGQTEEGEEDASNPPVPRRGEQIGTFSVERLLGKGAFSRVALARASTDKVREAAGEGERAVALKLVARSMYEGNERMRISLVREVEVLKTISHPSLVSLSSTFTTPLYTVLVLDFCPGGELFDFLTTWHSEITEGLARRMFGELADAVGWMHEMGLVHRDIKLENILLTCSPFPSLCATSPSALLASLPTPLLKLTDFGLSRFINPTSPLLATRCGSEAYAAPELIMGKKYDGRMTDAWALGVVLFAIVTGVMPFVEDPNPLHGSTGAAAGAGAGGMSDGEASKKGRRAYLMKIAKADYRWPGQGGPRFSSTSAAGGGSSTPSSSPVKGSHSRTPSSASASAYASTFDLSSTSHATRLLELEICGLARKIRINPAGNGLLRTRRRAGRRVRGVMRERRRGESEDLARRGSEMLDA
ncbi:hypothetical protein JCM11641_005478 [Rhodosporidiobolus odoratus]